MRRPCDRSGPISISAFWTFFSSNFQALFLDFLGVFLVIRPQLALTSAQTRKTAANRKCSGGRCWNGVNKPAALFHFAGNRRFRELMPHFTCSANSAFCDANRVFSFLPLSPPPTSSNIHLSFAQQSFLSREDFLKNRYYLSFRLWTVCASRLYLGQSPSGAFLLGFI